MTTISVLITGAASGIGNYIAKKYISKNYNVICIDQHDLIDIEKCRYYKCDLSDENQVINTFKDIKNINIAINCAGVSSIRKELIDFSSIDIVNGWSLNFLPTFNSLKQEISIMKKNGGGKIINIASISGHIGMKNFLAYGSAKASIINMTKVAAIEYAKDNIKINSISPATIDTPMIRKKYNSQLRDYSNVYYTKHCGTVNDIYSVVSMLEENNFMTGNDIILDGGLTNLFQI